MLRTQDYRLRMILFIAGLLIGAEVAANSMVSNLHPAVANETLEDALRRNIASTLEQMRGLTVHDPSRDVRWIEAPPGELTLTDTLSPHVFVVLATPPGSRSRDLYRLEARITPFGMVFDPGWIVNLSDTLESDDVALAVSGTRVATASRDQGVITSITVRDLAGEKPERVGTAHWSRTRKLGNTITNLEQTGTRQGIDLDYYSVGSESAPQNVVLEFVEESLVVYNDLGSQELARIELTTGEALGPLALSHYPPELKMEYDFLNWLADRGRGLADEGLAPRWAGVGIELLKEVYFKAQEVKADIEEVALPDEPLEAEKAEIVEEAILKARFQAETTTLPWPPPPLEPMLGERTVGEGVWAEVPQSEVQHAPNAPAPFYRTYLRPEPDYRRKKVYIVVWDPEQISLKMRAGTGNPVPQTGHRGDGRIPRDPAVLQNVVGGFNGGFQTSHVWYGMMVDRKVLLRPREWGATIGSWEDGRTAFGTWKPFGDIPEDLVSFRQNLPPLIEDGVWNPYRRNTWGWHQKVAGAEEGRTIRSALCYTQEGYVMYFYSEFSNEHGLANTLFHCRCRYAVHLDMNRGHTGFEFYRLMAESEEAPDEESTKALEGLRFFGTSLHPSVRHMKAPVRYLGVDYRDFFYLVFRSVVPGPDLEPLVQAEPSPGEGKWQMDQLPHNAEFPRRIATTWLRSTYPGGQLQILQMDPRGLTFTSLAQINHDGPPDHPQDSQPSSEKLMMTLPVGAPPNGAVGAVDLDGLQLQGSSLQTAPSGPVARATMFGKDPHGFLWVVDVLNAPLSDAQRVLEQRGVEYPMWTRPLSDDLPVRVYQSGEGEDGVKTLTEFVLGATEGKIVQTVTRDIPRIAVYEKERDARIVRLFPDMRPRRHRSQ